MDTLDSLIQKIRSVSEDPIIQKLAEQLGNWKLNNNDVFDLYGTVLIMPYLDTSNHILLLNTQKTASDFL